jgi:hypothetical protein
MIVLNMSVRANRDRARAIRAIKLKELVTRRHRALNASVVALTVAHLAGLLHDCIFS